MRRAGLSLPWTPWMHSDQPLCHPDGGSRRDQVAPDLHCLRPFAALTQDVHDARQARNLGFHAPLASQRASALSQRLVGARYSAES